MKRIVVIGAGPGGLCAGKRLKDAGFTDFVILERASGVGGTWRHNTYPGCRCDVPSMLYSFSFAPSVEWSEPYAGQDEIRRYMEQVAERFGLTPHIRLNTRASGAEWNDKTQTWTVTTDDGETFVADILIGAVGLFNEPAYPDIPGLSDFKGAMMHSAIWDHSVPLDGQRIGVIGSAASAVQFVPEIAKVAKHVTIYQRTPNYVNPRQNAFSEEFLAGLRTDPETTIKNERRQISAWLDSVCTYDDQEVLAAFKQAAMDNLAQVKDPVVREKLTPKYPFGSKRGLVSSDWYPTFNRDNVELVTDKISRVTEKGIASADGQERAFDVIVLATGFQTTKFFSAIPVAGKDGRSLSDVWSGGAQAYLGITVPGFPNMFMLYGPNTNNGSILHNIECQVDYIVGKVSEMERDSIRSIDLKPESCAAYNAALQEDLAKVSVWHSGVSDYYRAESGLIVTQWPHSMTRYQTETQRPDMSAYNVVSGA